MTTEHEQTSGTDASVPEVSVSVEGEAKRAGTSAVGATRAVPSRAGAGSATTDDGIDWDGLLVDDASPPRSREGRPHPLVLVAAALLGATVVLVVGMLGRWNLPWAPAEQVPAPAATSTPSIDPLRLARMQARVAANPADAGALAALGDLYSEAGDASAAKEWHAKALAVAPNDLEVLLAYGVDLFNLRDYPGATAAWVRVTDLKPTDVNAWYNLGWAYMSADPPLPDKADAAWARVLQLAPDSDMAKTVRGHQPTASPTPPR